LEYERDVQPRPKLGRWTEELEGLLAGNAAKAAREQLTLIRIFEEIRGRGYDGGYDAVRRYARRWAKEHGQATAAAYVPLSFAPGEAYQFDWSHEVVLLSGATVIVKVAHVRLCHSRMLFVRAYPRETQEMVFDAHDRAFALFKGACGRGIYDNMKTAVETIFVGKGRLYNRRFLQMCSHYLIDPVACTPASGWEKGQGDYQNFCVRPVIRHELTKRSLNMTANCVFAWAHSRGGRFHSAVARFNTRYSSFVAASSEGKCPLVLTARRSFEFSASMAFVTGMRIAVPLIRLGQLWPWRMV